MKIRFTRHVPRESFLFVLLCTWELMFSYNWSYLRFWCEKRPRFSIRDSCNSMRRIKLKFFWKILFLLLGTRAFVWKFLDSSAFAKASADKRCWMLAVIAGQRKAENKGWWELEIFERFSLTGKWIIWYKYSWKGLCHRRACPECGRMGRYLQFLSLQRVGYL